MLEQNLFILKNTVLFSSSLTVFTFLTHRSVILLVSSRILEIMRFNTEKGIILNVLLSKTDVMSCMLCPNNTLFLF